MIMKFSRLFPLASALFIGPLIQLLALVAACFNLPTTSAAEYTLRGTVTQEAFFYDKEGDLLNQSPEPDLPLIISCEFLYYRKGNLWKLHIVHPDPTFGLNAVWRSIMPFSETNLIDIISYPERTNVVGNASVTILNSRFPLVDLTATHFAWTVLNIDEIRGMLGTQLKCQPFWKSGGLQRSGIKTHQILETATGWVYWNSGKYPQQDAEGNVVIENHKPIIRSYPPPLEKGFSEGEARVEWNSTAKDRVPSSAHAIFVGPIKRPRDVEISMIPLCKVDLHISSYTTNAIDDSVFDATWTNSVASVVDHRIPNQGGSALSFLTKTNSVTPSFATLQEHRRIASTMRSLTKSTGSNIEVFGSVLIILIVVAPLFYWIRRK
jgi:hypothetical protein